MAEVLQESWTSEEQLENLARLKREKQIVKGVVTSVGIKKAKVLEDRKYVEKELEIAVFMLEGGITAYCPQNEFSDYEHKSIASFTGTMQEFIIEDLNFEDKTAIVSVKKADRIKSENFFASLKELESNGALKDHIFEGIVSGFNPKTRRIFVKINGTDCYMERYDWDWNRNGNLAERMASERGSKIKVKVLRFDKEQKLVKVSRRHTIEDPFIKLEKLMDMESVAGEVTGASVHGIFIKLEMGIEVKGSKPSYLEDPIVGDIVTCKVRNVDRKTRHARVVITGYPRGKKKRKDVGAFLFE